MVVEVKRAVYMYDVEIDIAESFIGSILYAKISVRLYYT